MRNANGGDNWVGNIKKCLCVNGREVKRTDEDDVRTTGRSIFGDKIIIVSSGIQEQGKSGERTSELR